ncbi:MAG: hypothetical protein R2753_06680 [Chitinophagales bacterium]
MMIANPYYYLKSDYYGSGEIWVNDVLVQTIKGPITKSGVLSAQIPINHAVLETGVYPVKCKLFPRFETDSLNSKSGFKVKFYNCDIYNWDNTNTEINPPLISPKNYINEEYKVASELDGLPYFEMNTQIEVLFPKTLEGWQNSVELQDIDGIEEQVFSFYKGLYRLLENHDAQTFLDIAKDKEILQQQAFYLSPTKVQQIREGMKEIFGRGLNVVPYKITDLRPVFMGYGKLISLVRTNGKPFLQFDDPENETTIDFPVKLQMKELGGQLSII